MSETSASQPEPQDTFDAHAAADAAREPESAPSVQTPVADAQPVDMQLAQAAESVVRIRVIGVGGAGSNAVDRLVFDKRMLVHSVVVNTDAQALNEAKTADKILLGRELTRGLSTGGDAELGLKVAHREREKLISLCEGQDLVFIVAGLGGGTGSGIAPELAQIAAAQGALVIGFAALPFTLEGQRRNDVAHNALGRLRSACDALMPLPNDLLFQHLHDEATAVDAFAQADAWIARAIASICTMVQRTGLINLDLATLRTAFVSGGRTLFGLGRGSGEECVDEALNDLLLCPLLNAPEHARGADKLLLNIIGGKDLSLTAINRILTTVNEHFGSREQTVLGAVIDESLSQCVELCVIGTTDLGGNSGRRRRAVALPRRDILPSAMQGGAEDAQPLPQLPSSESQAEMFASHSGDSIAQGGVGVSTAGGGSVDGATPSNADTASADAAPASALGGFGNAAGLPAAHAGVAGGGLHTAAGGAGAGGGAEPVRAAQAGDDAHGGQNSGFAAEAAGTADANARFEARPAAGDSLFARDVDLPDSRPAPKPERAVHESKLKQRRQQAARAAADGDSQSEFHFVADQEQRGIFEKTPRNMMNGEDLDVPTFLRRNIRISLA